MGVAHMNKPAAISGDFADLRSVKTRSVVQIVIECPIEEGERIVQMFGFPQPGKPVRLAIARLNLQLVEKEKAAGEKPVRTWSDLSPAQQAGIRCNEPAFWKFLSEGEDDLVEDADRAAVFVRFICGVHSRADIAKSAAALRKWRDLEAKFQVWLMDAAPDTRNMVEETA